VAAAFGAETIAAMIDLINQAGGTGGAPMTMPC
jgi:hypothetical protein